jgi:hypothetical protein
VSEGLESIGARGAVREGPLLLLLEVSWFPPVLLLFPLYEGVHDARRVRSHRAP